MPLLPPRPAENDDPWWTKREAWDAAVAANLALASYTLVEYEIPPATTNVTGTVADGAPAYSAPSKFGAKSLTGGALSFAGIIPTPTTFTVELWFYCTAESAARGLWSIGVNTWVALVSDPRVLRIALQDASSMKTSTVVVSPGVWHHLAVQISRSGPTDTLTSWYLDGVALDQAPFSGSTPTWTTAFDVGKIGNPGNDIGPNRVDEYRISTGHRYSGPFTPPTAAFVADATTLFIYHAESAQGEKPGTGSSTYAYPPRPDVAGGHVAYIGATEPTTALELDTWRDIS